MEISFKGKVVVVTGATSGIGYQIAESFSREGAAVAICSRSAESVASTVERLKIEGSSVIGEAVDVSVRNDLFTFADRVEETFGGIDIWVSNAAICPLGRLIDTPEDVWQQTMEVNVKSVFYGGLIAADKIKKRGGGVLIHAASFSSFMPAVSLGAYSVSKAAVYSMTKILAAELAPYNIRVVGYVPGITKTPLTEEYIQTKSEMLLKPIPMRRFGTPEDVANAVLFAASDKASYITGAFIEMAGGKYCVQDPTVVWDLA